MARNIKRRTTPVKKAPPMSRTAKIKLIALIAVFAVADIAIAYYYFFLRADYAQTGIVPDVVIVEPLRTADNDIKINENIVIPAEDTLTDIAVPPPPKPVVEESAVNISMARPAAVVTGNKSYRFRVPSNNPMFGTGFDYSRAVSGYLAQVPLTSRARSGILIDMNNHQVLWEKEAYKPVPIASMTKMMTILLLFEKMEADPRITLDTMLPVSKAASMVGESSVYLRENEVFALRDYMKAVIIKSANDAAYAIGEYVGGGDINNFLEMMNKRAKELHMPGTKFYTPNGLPDAKKRDCLSTAEGMALVAERLLEYPLYLEFSSSKGGKIRQMVYASTNRLLGKVKGVDGMKTGYTRNAGSCITVSCLRDGRRLLLVLTGFASGTDRNNCATQLLEWGYKQP